MAAAPVVRSLAEIAPHHIGDNRTVKLAVLSGPAQGSRTTVVLEIWEPGGSQPDNSHPASSETFVVLKGTARAHSDEHVAELGPDGHRPWALVSVRTAEGAITGITSFLDTRLFELFGLPASL